MKVTITVYWPNEIPITYTGVKHYHVSEEGTLRFTPGPENKLVWPTKITTNAIFKIVCQ
jgi:hypothetical protein